MTSFKIALKQARRKIQTASPEELKLSGFSEEDRAFFRNARHDLKLHQKPVISVKLAADQVTISYPEKFANADPRALEYIVIHELRHVAAERDAEVSGQSQARKMNMKVSALTQVSAPLIMFMAAPKITQALNYTLNAVSYGFRQESLALPGSLTGLAGLLATIGALRMISKPRRDEERQADRAANILSGISYTEVKRRLKHGVSENPAPKKFAEAMATASDIVLLPLSFAFKYLHPSELGRKRQSIRDCAERDALLTTHLPNTSRPNGEILPAP